MWPVLAGFHPKSSNPHRVSYYEEYKDDLNFNGIKFPVEPNDISKFERQNDVSINYFVKKIQRGKGKIYYEVSPLHVTKKDHEKGACEFIRRL